MKLRKNRILFRPTGIPFAEIIKNEFLPLAEQKIHTGRSAAREVMRQPSLLLNLKCPGCGASFSADYYARFNEQGKTECPACGLAAGLNKSETRKIFENQLRTGLQKAGDDPVLISEIGETIAKAAILLEPIFIILVVGFTSKRIGHYIRDTALFCLVCKIFLGPLALLIAFPPKPEDCSNSYLASFWERSGKLLVTPAARDAYDRLRLLSGHNEDNPAVNLPTAFYHQNLSAGMVAYRYPTYKPRHNRHLIDLRDIPYWHHVYERILPDHGPVFSFTEEEEKAGKNWLADRGIDGNYVVFAGRDSAYTASILPRNNDWPQQTAYRDMDIKNFIPAMKWLAKRQLPSIRHGSVVAELLPRGLPEKIIDLPASPRDELSEFLDIYLYVKAAFTVSAGTGISETSSMEGRPHLDVNTIVMPASLLAKNNRGIFFMFKKIWNFKTGRFLTLREMFESKANAILVKGAFEQRGLRPVENSPEEILAGVKEMHERFIAKTWVTTDRELQWRAEFSRLFKSFYPQAHDLRSSLSHSFCLMNPWLFN